MIHPKTLLVEDLKAVTNGIEDAVVLGARPLLSIFGDKFVLTFLNCLESPSIVITGERVTKRGDAWLIKKENKIYVVTEGNDKRQLKHLDILDCVTWEGKLLSIDKEGRAAVDGRIIAKGVKRAIKAGDRLLFLDAKDRIVDVDGNVVAKKAVVRATPIGRIAAGIRRNKIVVAYWNGLRELDLGDKVDVKRVEDVKWRDGVFCIDIACSDMDRTLVLDHEAKAICMTANQLEPVVSLGSEVLCWDPKTKAIIKLTKEESDILAYSSVQPVFAGCTVYGIALLCNKELRVLAGLVWRILGRAPNNIHVAWGKHAVLEDRGETWIVDLESGVKIAKITNAITGRAHNAVAAIISKDWRLVVFDLSMYDKVIEAQDKVVLNYTNKRIAVISSIDSIGSKYKLKVKGPPWLDVNISNGAIECTPKGWGKAVLKVQVCTPVSVAEKNIVVEVNKPRIAIDNVPPSVYYAIGGKLLDGNGNCKVPLKIKVSNPSGCRAKIIARIEGEGVRSSEKSILMPDGDKCIHESLEVHVNSNNVCLAKAILEVARIDDRGEERKEKLYEALVALQPKAAPVRGKNVVILGNNRKRIILASICANEECCGMVEVKTNRRRYIAYVKPGVPAKVVFDRREAVAQLALKIIDYCNEFEWIEDLSRYAEHLASEDEAKDVPEVHIKEVTIYATGVINVKARVSGDVELVILQGMTRALTRKAGAVDLSAKVDVVKPHVSIYVVGSRGLCTIRPRISICDLIVLGRRAAETISESIGWAL